MKTRAIRNNNPLNIRFSPHNDWQGKVLVNNDGTFEQFMTMSDGFLAAFHLIETYMLRYSCNTLTTIISRWAPPSENRTSDYIRFVCQQTGIGGQEWLSNHDPRLVHIVRAMAIMEAGRGIMDYESDLQDAFGRYIPKLPQRRRRRL